MFVKQLLCFRYRAKCRVHSLRVLGQTADRGACPVLDRLCSPRQAAQPTALGLSFPIREKCGGTGIYFKGFSKRFNMLV